ncbi:MAG: EAL domain-containing protein, partial [Eubacteriales bacterium]|nr:EAL domain-containing protein [Eubacteriales bacterium]
SFNRAVALYDNSLHEKELFAEQLIEDFHTAIREKQFTVHYQPKFDVRPSEPVLSSAEALVRWKHPEFGIISPGVFIPLFEENGLIRELDSFVWREAAAQIQAWKKTLGRSIPVSVNVSRIDLYDPLLRENLEGLASEFNLSRGELLLEITESAYTENSDQIISVVSGLRESGFQIEMDDFGTGYSSLNMISTLPIDVLKLDMQFIRTAFKKRKDTRLLEAIIGLAKSMDLPTVAEGVETAEQVFTLKSMGCDVIQGYFFSKPLPADEFEVYVRGLDKTTGAAADSVEIEPRFAPRNQFINDALHDPLTGLYNHSAFDILFHDSDKDHIAVMIAKVDDYPSIPRERGRAYAERVILRVAEVLRGSFRSVDDICRLQEDEFVVIMSRMTGAMRKLVLHKVEQINAELQRAQDELEPISLSVGIAFSDRENPQGDVFVDADTALRNLKQIRRSGCSVF